MDKQTKEKFLELMSEIISLRTDELARK